MTLLSTILDTRERAIEAAYIAGVAPLLLADLADLPGLLARAEYACKSQWFEFILHGAINDLLWQMNHEAGRNWD